MQIRTLILLPLASLVSFAQTGLELPHSSVTLIDALQSTLAKHPGIQIQEQQLNLNEGALRVASGQFDTTLSANMSQARVYTPLTFLQQFQYSQLGFNTSSITSDTTNYTMTTQKLFRNGIAFNPSITLSRNTDNLATRQGLNEAQFSFQVVLPFLRGRGRAAVDAQELASQSVVEATVNDVNQTVAQLLVNTAISYWNAVAAVQSLQIAKDSEARGARYVLEVRTLIEADKVAKGEINQLLANLDGRTASRIAAEQGVINAQQSLALGMGLKAGEIEISPDTSDPLPDWQESSSPLVTAQLVNEYVANAMRNRSDILAAKLRRQSAQQILPAARNQLRPQLNLTINAGYNGLLEGTGFGRPFGALFYNVPGPNAYASLNFLFPPRNDVAIGQLAQANAAYQQSTLTEADLERNISSSVVTASTTLSNSITALKKAREAVAYYRIALDGELEKYRLGLSSLLEVLTMEDRLTGALSQEVSAHLNYAVAIENLRFATGTVIDPNQRVHALVKNTFLQPPAENEMHR